MALVYRLVVLLSLVMILHSDSCKTNADPLSILSLVQDLIQYNIAGIPVIHEKTEWHFDPELGQQRRIRYEEENGRYGENAIARIGMGIGYNGPWGTKALDNKPVPASNKLS